MTPTKIIAAAITAVLMVSPAVAQGTKVAIGISGWTGFAPLVLAKEAGIYSKNGLDVSIKKIPQASRHLAIASGDVQCAATTVETWIVWNANGVATNQLFQMDKSYGADGMVVRNTIASIKDIKGKTVAASAPGTAPYFTLAWRLFLTETGQEIQTAYEATGIADAVTLINAIFATSFGASDYTAVARMLDILEPRLFGEDIEESDAFAFVQGGVDGIAYMTIALPAFPVAVAIDEITTPGALTLTEIP